MSLSCSLLVWVFLIAASYYLCLWKDDVSLKEKWKEQFYFVSNWFDTRIDLFASGEHNLYHKELGLSEQTHTFVYRCMCTGFHFWQKGRAWQGRDKASLTSLVTNSCTIVIRLFRVGVFKSLQLLLFCSEHRRQSRNSRTFGWMDLALGAPAGENSAILCKTHLLFEQVQLEKDE